MKPVLFPVAATAAFLAALAAAPMAFAQSHGASARAASAMQPAAGMHEMKTSGHGPMAPDVDGEVRKVDRAQGKLTLRHGPIPNLGMDAMTMVFRVADRAMLEGLEPGQKVRFLAEDPKGVLTVTAIEVVR